MREVEKKKCDVENVILCEVRKKCEEKENADE